MSKIGPRHAPTLSTGLAKGTSQDKVVGSADVRKKRYSEQSLKDFNNLRELVSDFDNAGLHGTNGTNYEDLGSSVDPNIDKTSGLPLDLQQNSMSKDIHKFSQGH